MVKSPDYDKIPDINKIKLVNQDSVNIENSTAFKRMKISGEINNNINKLQLSSPAQSEDSNDNANTNTNDLDKMMLTKEDYVEVENNSLSVGDSFSSSNSSSSSFVELNNKPISNSRNDMNEGYAYRSVNTPENKMENNSLIKNSLITDDTIDDDYSPPPSYDSLYPTKKHIRGTNGLYNLGNTCFMNSGIQCIANTAPLREYFMKGLWKKEINLTSIHGMKGKMVKAFVKVLENLWSETDSPFRPVEFKSVIGQYTPLFEGYHQHDCQEFIASLLDGLHEDINRVKIKKFEEYPEMDKLSDAEAAKLSWELNIRRENSIIVDLFYGQYRSINICNSCHTKRLNFEPFVYLTLPIPETQEVELPITVLINGKKFDILKIVVLKSDTILTLKQRILDQLLAKKSSAPNDTIPNDLDGIEFDLDSIEVYQSREYYINSMLRNNDTINSIPSLENNYYLFFAYINTNKYLLTSLENMNIGVTSSNSVPSTNDVMDGLSHSSDEEKHSSTTNTINLPVYQSVENAERYRDEDNGAPFFVNLPDLSLLEDEEKGINKQQLGWIIYRELVKYYQTFTDKVIATLDEATHGFDEGVMNLKKKIKEEEEELNRLAANRINHFTKNTNNNSKMSFADDEHDDLYGDPKEENNKANQLVVYSQGDDDDGDNQIPTLDHTNEKDLSEGVPMTPQELSEKSDDVDMKESSDHEDNELENAYQESNKTKPMSSDGEEEEEKEKKEKPEPKLEELYPINDGWSIMSKLFDVEIIYPNRKNENSFYSFMYNTTSSTTIPLYQCKQRKNSNSKNYYGSNSHKIYNETTNEKLSLKDKKDLLIMVTWNPEILKYLFGETKFEVFKHDKDKEKQFVKKIEAPPINMEECLQEFIKEEILTGENKWFCPECKDYREAYKKMDIWAAPEILIVHLKRFIQDRRFYSSRKNNVLVKFPIKGLDLTDIIIGPKSKERYIYNLYAISNHSGSTGGGHYTAYIKNNEKWYHFNDSYVSEESEENIMTSKAYLLFYQRCHEPGKEFKLPNLDNVPDVVCNDEEDQLNNNNNNHSPFSLNMDSELSANPLSNIDIDIAKDDDNDNDNVNDYDDIGNKEDDEASVSSTEIKPFMDKD